MENVYEELTPAWWQTKASRPDVYIVIPDTEYDNPNQQINYGEGTNSGDTDFLTGVIVKAPKGQERAIGLWCHYRMHGPYVFHPFRERFSNGKASPIEKKVAKAVNHDDMVLITDKKIF